MNPETVVVPDGNLSIAWATAFVRVFEAVGGELADPLVLSITDFSDAREPVETKTVRDALDESISRINGCRGGGRAALQTVSATAATIFPHMCWSPQGTRPAVDLFQHYQNRVYPRLTKLCRLNAGGTYFLRMINSTGVASDGTPREPVNQLGDILRWWQRGARNGKRTRRSAMQVSIYDPSKDHTGAARSKFPCLQQVSFAYTKRGLSLSAYYPTEFIFDRGYGNYLGLCRLAAFMAHEMDLALDRVNIVVALAKLGGVAKRTVSDLAATLRILVGDSRSVSHQ